MSETKLDPYIIGFGISAVITAIFNGVLNVTKELLVIDGDKILKDGILKPIGGLLLVVKPHHWTGHAIVVFSVFIIIGLVISLSNIHEELTRRFSLDHSKLGWWIFFGTIIGLALTGFLYFWEAFLL